MLTWSSFKEAPYRSPKPVHNLKMFNISDSISDAADGADSAAADDGDNFMYESSDSETDCDLKSMRRTPRIYEYRKLENSRER